MVETGQENLVRGLFLKEFDLAQMNSLKVVSGNKAASGKRRETRAGRSSDSLEANPLNRKRKLLPKVLALPHSMIQATYVQHPLCAGASATLFLQVV